MIFVLNHLHDFRDYISTAFDQHPVPNLHAESFDLILVVQRGALNGGSPNGNGSQGRQGRQLACAPDLYKDLFDLRDRGPCRILVGDGPTRSFTSKSELPPHLRSVHFDYDAVDFIGQLVALRLHFADERQQFVHIV